MSEVLYQVRVKSVKEGSAWGIWTPCTKESYDDFLTHPEKHAIKDLVVEVRTMVVGSVNGGCVMSERLLVAITESLKDAYEEGYRDGRSDGREGHGDKSARDSCAESVLKHSFVEMHIASMVASHVAEVERLKHELYLLKSAAFEVLTARDPDDEQFGYPGHAHRVRGKWDRDGSTCEQCAAFDNLSKLLGDLK